MDLQRRLRSSALVIIEEGMRPFAEAILKNKLDNFTIHPVILIIYNETHKFTGSNAIEMKQEIVQAVCKQCQKIDEKYYDGILPPILARYTYIVMPVWDLETLLDEFVAAL